MRRMTKRRLGFTASLIGAFTCLSFSAQGAGFEIREQSAVLQGSSLAGQTAGGYDSAGQFYNPATLSLLKKKFNVEINTALIRPSLKVKSAQGLVPKVGIPIQGRTSEDAGSYIVVPSFYASYRFDPQWTIGLAVNSPFGLETEYDKNWVGRYEAIRSDLRTVTITPSISWKPVERIALSVGFAAQYAKATLTSATLLGFNPLTRMPIDGYTKVKGDDWGYGVVLGAIVQLNASTRFGISYRSQIRHKLTGDITIDSPKGRVLKTQGSAKIVTPDIVRMGIHHDLNDKWAIMGDVSWTNWSVFDELRVKSPKLEVATQEHWKDSWFAALGTQYKATKAWTFRGGVAFDQSPVSTQYRTARIPDNNRVWLSLGASYEPSDNIKITMGYSHIFVPDTKIRSHNLNVDYENSIDILALSGTFKW